MPATLDVATERPVDRLEVALVLPDGVEVEGDQLPVALHMGWDDERELELSLQTTWGSWAIGDVLLRARDRFGLLVWEERDRALADRSRTYPRPEQLRRLVAPAQLQAVVGSEVARVRVGRARVRRHAPLRAR